MQGGQLTLSSSGAMSGPGWSIDSSGNARFANSAGSFSAGGGSSVNGGFSCGSIGGGAWGGPGGSTMDAKNITVFTKLGLARTSATATPGGSYKVPTNTGKLSDYITVRTEYQTITGTISGTAGGESVSGNCSIRIPTVSITINDTGRVITEILDLGSQIVTGWSSTDTVTAAFLCSQNPNQQATQD